MYSTVILLSIASIVASHDLIVGTNTEGRKIYDEIRQASPAIWRQVENITVTTTDAEVISRIVITDLRPDKDGDIKVVEGGEGQKNVTLELKSPTVLRGYDFQIQVFSIPEDQIKSGEKRDLTSTTDATQTRVQRNPVEERNRATFNPPRATPLEKKVETSTTPKNVTPISDDTKVNKDNSKSTNKDSEDVNDRKDVPAPFVGNVPQGFNVTTVTTTGERRARDTSNVETPAEIQISPKINGKVDDSATHRPLLASRQSFFNRSTSSTTNKPVSDNDGKRDARDTDNNNKSDGSAKTNEPSSTHHPALIVRQDSTPSGHTTKRPNSDKERVVRDTEHDKKSVNESTNANENSSTQVPALVARQGLYNKPSELTPNKAETKDDGKRDARGTENDKKSGDNVTPNENISTLPPALISRQGIFNTPLSVTTNKPTGINNNGKRDARNTEDDKKSDKSTATHENFSTQKPALIARQGLINTPTATTPVQKPSEGTYKLEEVKRREVRDTEHNKKNGEENDSAKEYPSTPHPAFIVKQGTLGPLLVSTTNKPEIKEKRDATNTNNHNAPSENSSTEHPALIARQGLNRPTFKTAITLTSTTNKPDNNDGKRNARDAEHENKSDNTTPKADAESRPVSPRLSFNSKPLVDVKTYTPKTEEQDKLTTENKDEIDTKPRGLFVPPPGYKRVVPANPDARVARDADEKSTTVLVSAETHDVENKDDETIDASASSKDLTSNNNKAVDFGRLHPAGVHLPKQVTSTVSPATKSQNKRETEPKVASTEKKEKEDNLKYTPRSFGEHNSTLPHQLPVISIQ